MYRVYKNFLVFNIKHKKIKCGFKRKYCSENVHNLSNTGKLFKALISSVQITVVILHEFVM